MPRQGRIDYPGALHHVMVRGMEKRKLFRDNRDRKVFLERLGRFVTSTGNGCYAYALMPNHFHLLLVTGEKTVSSLMQSLLTSYASYYNRRHNRTGKLYANRYKSILCDRDSYFLALVRYIHLNPLKEHLVPHMKALSKYKWTGHHVLMGNGTVDWLDVDETLRMFAETEATARVLYEQFVAEGLAITDEHLEGGGLIRSVGGKWNAREALGREKNLLGDERILGDSDFVERVLKAAMEKEDRVLELRNMGWDIERVVSHAAEIVGVEPEELKSRSKNKTISTGRALACKWLMKDLKLRGIDIANYFEITPSAVSILAKRGVRHEKELGITLGNDSHGDHDTPDKKRTCSQP